MSIEENVFNNPYLTTLIFEKIDCDYRKRNLLRFSEVNKNTAMMTQETRRKFREFEKNYVKDKFEKLFKNYMIWWASLHEEPCFFYLSMNDGYEMLDDMKELAIIYETFMTEICNCDALEQIEKLKIQVDEYYWWRKSEDQRWD